MARINLLGFTMITPSMSSCWGGITSTTAMAGSSSPCRQPNSASTRPKDRPTTAGRATVAEFRAAGVEVRGDPEGFGITTTVVLPGDLDVMLDKPRHRSAI